MQHEEYAIVECAYCLIPIAADMVKKMFLGTNMTNLLGMTI